MKFIDWFAGVGGFRRGMELAGHECVGFCEFDKYAVASYTAMHLCTQEQLDYLATLPLKKRQKEILKEQYRNGEWYANDVRSVDARNIPDADCWCFGFPCQDISVAGKQLGFTGNRSSLFFRIMYMVGQLEEEKRPTYLFIENVKNLLSVNGGWDFARLLSELDKNGYDAEWQVLNSKYFGVPQNRERCFIIGHLRGRSRSKVFPVEGTDGADSVHGIGHRDGCRRNTQVFDSDGITEALDTGQGSGRGHHTIEVIGKTEGFGHDQNNRVYGSDGCSPCLNGIGNGGNHEPKVGIEVIANTRPSKVADRTRILSGVGYQSMPPQHGSQRPSESRVVVVGNTNPSGNGMNGNCYFSEGLNPTLTCNKNEGNRVAIPIGIIDDQGRTTKRCDVKDTAPTLRSQTHGNEPKVAIPVLTPDRANKRQNGRRFKEDGEEAFTLTSQDRHGVAVEVSVEPVQMSGCELSEQSDEAHSLNCTDQRKVFGAHQKRTMVGYNATLKNGGGVTQTALALNARDYKGLSGSSQMMTAAAMLLEKDTNGTDGEC